MSYLLAVRSLGMMTLMQVLTDHASLAITEVQKDQPVLPAAGDMNCIVGSPFDPNADSKLTSVEYWYGVETTVNDTSNFKYPVESKIYNASISSISWCYQYNGGRRVQATEETFFLDRHGRRLGIMAINSGPVDLVKLNITCPQKKKNADDFCFVFQGSMTFLSHETDDLSMSIEAIRTGIKAAMANDTLLDPVELPTVTRIAYLGDTENDVLNWGNGDRVDDDRGGIVTPGGTNKAYVPILAVSMFGAALIVLMLLLLRRQRTMVTQRQLDVGAAVAAASEEEVSLGCDPPGSFHQGYYHYTKDGVRYLSPYCQTCLETEGQLALGHGLETIAEDEVWMEGRNFTLVGANSRDLGGRHSTMDVHSCTSAICRQCTKKQNDVNFISWRQRNEGDVTYPNVAASASPRRSTIGRSIEI